MEDKIIIYQTEDGQTAIDVKLEQETVWLTIAQMVELFDTERKKKTRWLKLWSILSIRTISHLISVFAPLILLNPR